MDRFTPTDDAHDLPMELRLRIQQNPEAVWGMSIGGHFRKKRQNEKLALYQQPWKSPVSLGSISSSSSEPSTTSGTSSSYSLLLSEEFSTHSAIFSLPILFTTSISSQHSWTLPFNLTVTISPRDLARKRAIAAGIESARDPRLIAIYSDAALSREKRFAGAACVWRDANSVSKNDSLRIPPEKRKWFSYSEHLSDQGDITIAETLGVIFALKAALPLARKAKEFVSIKKIDSKDSASFQRIHVRIFTDSQECLRRIQLHAEKSVVQREQIKVTPGLKVLADAVKDLTDLGNVTVELAWVPGHDIVEGNSQADKVAKEAAYSKY